MEFLSALAKRGAFVASMTVYCVCACAGDFSLSQTGVICKFLGKKYGLYPTTEEDEWHADQLNTTVHDYIAEGRTIFRLLLSLRTWAATPARLAFSSVSSI